MTNLEPSGLARRLLERLALENEPLAGDLVEEFLRRRSRSWLWYQLIAALIVHALYGPHPPVSLNLTPVDPVVAEWQMSKRLYKRRNVSLSGSPIEGIGGLTMVILCFIMTSVVPAIWWFVVAGIGSGIVLGAARVRMQKGVHSQIRRLEDW